MYKMYAADPRAKLNLGIRRRLAPLMDNDPERIKLMNSLLLSMPARLSSTTATKSGWGQFLPGRPQWRPHADAVEPRSECRILASRPAAAVSAPDHGPDLRL